MTNYLDISELLKVELPGKKSAMAKYDDILWKIRSGYLVVLAGALGMFVTKDSPLVLSIEMLLIIFWFSLMAWAIDISFRRRQLRVAKAYNELFASAIKNLPKGSGLGSIDIRLFHVSGENLEGLQPQDGIAISKCLIPSIFIYMGTPLVSVLLYLLQLLFRAD